MRLLNARTLEIHEFPGDSDKEYAILSHTWDVEECTLQNFSLPEVSARKGFAKIRYCCDQAVVDGLDWAWVDTCCIDKTSTAELSEAINSMFRWYKQASVCYVYLADAANRHDFATSRWFTRGWTLQKLIAPRALRFYSLSWIFLGSKFEPEISSSIETITGIDHSVLLTGDFSRVCIARRMSWAARRVTTRVEDRAYSLMGLFDINIPLIYGEAHKAFLRLQQEILKVSDDQSLFAWGIPKFLGRLEQPFGQPADQTTTHGLFADSPSDFATDYEVITLLGEKDIEPPVLYGNGLRVKFPSLGEESIKYILLACTIRGSLEWYLGIPLRQWHPIYTARCGDPALIPASRRSSARNDAVVVRPLESNLLSSYPATFTIVRVPDLSDLSLNDYFDLDEIYCLPHGTYNPAHRRISFPTGAQGPHAALFFVPSTRRKDLRPRLGSQRPISGLPSFVIALGSYESAWAEACVIIQDDSTLPATWDSATEQLPVRKVFCRQPMTKEAFKARLNSNNPREPCLMTQEHNDWKAEDQIEYTITSSTDGFLSPWSNRFCQHIVRLRCWGISICIRLETRALNLVETTVYVSINIHMEYTEKVYDVRRITKNNLVQLLNKRQPMPVKSKTVYHDKQLVDHNFKPD